MTDGRDTAPSSSRTEPARLSVSPQCRNVLCTSLRPARDRSAGAVLTLRVNVSSVTSGHWTNALRALVGVGLPCRVPRFTSCKDPRSRRKWGDGVAPTNCSRCARARVRRGRMHRECCAVPGPTVLRRAPSKTPPSTLLTWAGSRRGGDSPVPTRAVTPAARNDRGARSRRRSCGVEPCTKDSTAAASPRSTRAAASCSGNATSGSNRRARVTRRAHVDAGRRRRVE
jgi:hypothetical protein